VRERVRLKAEEQRAKMEEPTAIRLRDKLSFMLGVVGCFLIEVRVRGQGLGVRGQGLWVMG